KEMDKLLSSFVKKHIDTFNESELKLLCEFLDLDDDNLFKFKQNKETSIKIEPNIITNLFKNFVFKE
ncbi:MAG: succinate dehydrogenase assembly factor 2, partial [Alphaproteobacteria bacterium]|nr:succinate dehydrogenase assembly factor 2 [Alphaproteobacteria bacterium]